MSYRMTQALRADAQENRDRIVTAAQELFAERGLEVGMREIARRAGVGPATLYRRFPTRQALMEEAFQAGLETCQRIVAEGCADEDPWRGLAHVIENITALNVRDRGFVDAYMAADLDGGAVAKHRHEQLSLLVSLSRRAQASGRLREDFVINDLILILMAGRGITYGNHASRDAAARRFAALAIDGLRRH